MKRTTKIQPAQVQVRVLCLLILTQLTFISAYAFTSHSTSSLLVVPVKKRTGSTLTSTLTTNTLVTIGIRLSSSNNDDNVNANANANDSVLNNVKINTEKKDELLNLLSKVPPNQATPISLTDDIIKSVSNLEPSCPTNLDSVLDELSGNWELIWTAQDKSSKEVKESSSSLRNGIFGNWINPLENQSYSNSPVGIGATSSSGANSGTNSGTSKRIGGRSNPILPQNIQNKLENMGVLLTNDENENEDEEDNNISKNANDDDNSTVKSTQAIDLKKGRVRNVVSVLVNSPLFLPLPWSSGSGSGSGSGNRSNKVRGSLTVDVKFKPNRVDKRKIDVKFNECRVIVQNSPLDIKIPLGPIGPTGWLRTTYIDDTMRITRGHKGSIFILRRTSKR